MAILWGKLSGSSVAILISVAAPDKWLSAGGGRIVACRLLSAEWKIRVELFNVLSERASGTKVEYGHAPLPFSFLFYPFS
jgi:hypothetical protein